MSLYSDLSSRDFLEWVDPLIKRGTYTIRPADGKLVRQYWIASDSPWDYVRPPMQCNCPYYMEVIFSTVSARAHVGRFIHTRCHSCWKVVASCRTVADLFELDDYQRNYTKYDCKCGLDLRDHTSGCWGGYFYFDTVDQGLDALDKIREDLSEIDADVFLKRGCTEYEMALGPSNEWKVNPAQIPVQKLCDHYVVNDFPADLMKPNVTDHVHRRWIRHAYKIGDQTYKNFTDGHSLYNPSVRYERPEEEVERIAD